GIQTFANRASLCGSGSRVATAYEWTTLRRGIAPTHNYWTNDPLKWGGDGSLDCRVSTNTGSDCGSTPMRICTDSGSDAEGNVCNWQHCGLHTRAPDNFFGGCVGNTSAGAVCVPTPGCLRFAACPRWENGIARVPASGVTSESTGIGSGIRHASQ